MRRDAAHQTGLVAGPLGRRAAEEATEIPGQLRLIFRTKRKNDLVFIDFITDQTENVFPMVPGGKGLTEMILAEEL